MKRFLVVFLFVACLLCGCKANKEVKLRTDFLSFGCNVDYNGDKYCFDVETKENGEMTCLITYPETLSGMKCLVNNDNITINYKGVEIEKKLADMPFGSVISLFYAVKEDANEKPLLEKNGDYRLNGIVNDMDYEFLATEEGIPVSLTFKAEKIIMEFTNLTLVNP